MPRSGHGRRCMELMAIVTALHAGLAGAAEVVPEITRRKLAERNSSVVAVVDDVEPTSWLGQLGPGAVATIVILISILPPIGFWLYKRQLRAKKGGWLSRRNEEDSGSQDEMF
eukprot:TRINITY_DN13736_c0_g1_i2.p1 TRINITY_DN13736_c0_g1~~TRINITY_DN13736_c0_g1_i2.p1  ORF type:complete len:113 (-),score=19.02 TRINITY_DN13736_c0_g1_i2:202-540(-)